MPRGARPAADAPRHDDAPSQSARNRSSWALGGTRSAGSRAVPRRELLRELVPSRGDLHHHRGRPLCPSRKPCRDVRWRLGRKPRGEGGGAGASCYGDEQAREKSRASAVDGVFARVGRPSGATPGLEVEARRCWADRSSRAPLVVAIEAASFRDLPRLSHARAPAQFEATGSPWRASGGNASGDNARSSSRNSSVNSGSRSWMR